MKVVHIILSFSPGGAEILVKNLAIQLKESIDVEIWAIAKPVDILFAKKYRDELSQYKIRTFCFQKNTHRDRIKTIFQLRKKIKKSQPDIIHTHLEHVNLYTVLASIGLRSNIIHTIHSVKIEFIFIHRFFLKYFNKKYVAISIKIKELIEKKIKISQKILSLVYNGIKLEHFLQNKQEKNAGVNQIIAIGRLVPQKDYSNLLKAYQILTSMLTKEQTKIPKLIIVGDGREKEGLVKLANDLGISKTVFFMGIRTDIPQLLSASEIYVLSSQWEGLSISLIEALAAGISVVATDAGSNNEIIDHHLNGLIVPPQRPDLLAKAIYRLIKDSKLRKYLSKNGPKKAKIFGIESCAKGYLNIYKNIIKN